jgi:hypothetical protein
MLDFFGNETLAIIAIAGITIIAALKGDMNTVTAGLAGLVGYIGGLKTKSL